MTANDSRERFEAFASKKTAQAEAATLPPYVTEIEHAIEGLERIGNAWSRRLFDGDFYASPARDPSRPACSLVFVQSEDGNTVTDDPSTLGGGQVDKHLIYEGLAQVDADAVLAGSQTLGGDIVFSVWHPELVRLRASLGKPRHPTQIVATLRGLDCSRHLLFNVPEIPVLVLTIGSGAARMHADIESRPWVHVILMDKPTDLPIAFEEFHRRGIGRISAVGGRTVATQLLDARLVQDVYLTTSPRPGGDPGTPFYAQPLNARTIVRKHGTGPESDVRFEHLQILAPGDT